MNFYMMIQLPELHQEFLLRLHTKYALSTIVVDKNLQVFSKQLIENIGSEHTEMEAHCSYSHLMEIVADLEHQASLHGSFKIRISNGEIKTKKIKSYLSPRWALHPD